MEDVEIWGPPALRVALCSRGLVLEGSDLDLKLLVEQLQLLLFTEDIVTIEHHLLPPAILLQLLFLYLLSHLVKLLKGMVFLLLRRANADG